MMIMITMMGMGMGSARRSSFRKGEGGV
jgi:hypothetical protein